MRRLIEHRAAALRGVELLRPARTVEKVRVVDGVDHAHGPEARRLRSARAAAPPAHRTNGCGRPPGATPARSAASMIAAHSGKRQRHRLLDQEMLAVPGGEHRMTGVILMRRRHIDRLDRRIGAQFLDGRHSRGRRNPRRSAPAPPARVSAAATSATRGSPVKVGSIRVKARPRPATPRRSWRWAALLKGRPASTTSFNALILDS